MVYGNGIVYGLRTWSMLTGLSTVGPYLQTPIRQEDYASFRLPYALSDSEPTSELEYTRRHDPSEEKIEWGSGPS